MTEQQAKDILCTAIEGGGIYYWMSEECQNIIVDRSEKFGEESVNIDEWFYISISFEYEEKMYKVHYSDMMKKANEFIKKYPRLPIDDNHDAISADAFFQFCAFNEIIFG